MQTLLLDTKSWDLAVDASGNIAVASDPYAQAQDAASALKVFSGEVYFDTSQGVPYFAQMLGRSPPLGLMKQYFVDAAMTVPGVQSAQCFFSSWTGRVLKGQVQITNSDGDVSAAGF